jgi:HEAT repeat protein
MIDIGIDQPGHSLRMLVSQALRSYKTRNLYQFLEDRDPVVRTAAAREIQIRGTRDSYKYLLKMLDDKRGFIREICIFTLGQLGTPEYPFREESVSVLMRYLANDRNVAVRAAAAAALGHLRAIEALDSLIEASSDSSAEVRSNVAFALKMMKTRAKARNTLAMLKQDKNDNVRFWAND